MSEPQSTPGPWTTDGSRIFHQRNAGGKKLWIAETFQARAFTSAANLSGNDTVEQRHANARLIAAAPDLLEACQMLLIRLDGCGPDVPRGHVYELARAAIAKAEGA